MVVSATAKLGYPVHRIGISPAVTIGTLLPAVGSGAARAILESGELLDGPAALRLGLACQLSRDDAQVLTDAAALCQTIGGHGPQALRATKAWLNELDGSLDEERFEAPARDSARMSRTDDARRRLEAYWKDR